MWRKGRETPMWSKGQETLINRNAISTVNTPIKQIIHGNQKRNWKILKFPHFSPENLI